MSSPLSPFLTLCRSDDQGLCSQKSQVQNIWQQSPAAKISKDSRGWGFFFLLNSKLDGITQWYGRGEWAHGQYPDDKNEVPHSGKNIL